MHLHDLSSADPDWAQLWAADWVSVFCMCPPVSLNKCLLEVYPVPSKSLECRKASPTVQAHSKSLFKQCPLDPIDPIKSMLSPKVKGLESITCLPWSHGQCRILLCSVYPRAKQNPSNSMPRHSRHTKHKSSERWNMKRWTDVYRQMQNKKRRDDVTILRSDKVKIQP